MRFLPNIFWTKNVKNGHSGAVVALQSPRGLENLTKASVVSTSM